MTYRSAGLGVFILAALAACGGKAVLGNVDPGSFVDGGGPSVQTPDGSSPSSPGALSGDCHKAPAAPSVISQTRAGYNARAIASDGASLYVSGPTLGTTDDVPDGAALYRYNKQTHDVELASPKLQPNGTGQLVVDTTFIGFVGDTSGTTTFLSLMKKASLPAPSAVSLFDVKLGTLVTFMGDAVYRLEPSAATATSEILFADKGVVETSGSSAPWGTLTTLNGAPPSAFVAGEYFTNPDRGFLFVARRSKDQPFMKVPASGGPGMALDAAALVSADEIQTGGMDHDRDYLYVAATVGDESTTWGIARVSKGDGDATTHSPPTTYFPDGGDPISVVHVDSASIYYLTAPIGNAGVAELRRMCKDGTNIVTIASGGSILDFALDDTSVYYTLNGRLYAASK